MGSKNTLLPVPFAPGTRGGSTFVALSTPPYTVKLLLPPRVTNSYCVMRSRYKADFTWLVLELAGFVMLYPG